jgi:hypothetical protein
MCNRRINRRSFLCNGLENMYTTTEQLLKEAFSVGSGPRLYNEDPRPAENKSRVTTGSNTSTVALQVVGGDENGTQCLGV